MLFCDLLVGKPPDFYTLQHVHHRRFRRLETHTCRTTKCRTTSSVAAAADTHSCLIVAANASSGSNGSSVAVATAAA